MFVSIIDTNTHYVLMWALLWRFCWNEAMLNADCHQKGVSDAFMLVHKIRVQIVIICYKAPANKPADFETKLPVMLLDERSK